MGGGQRTALLLAAWIGSCRGGHSGGVRGDAAGRPQPRAVQGAALTPEQDVVRMSRICASMRRGKM